MTEWFCLWWGLQGSNLDPTHVRVCPTAELSARACDYNDRALLAQTPLARNPAWPLASI